MKLSNKILKKTTRNIIGLIKKYYYKNQVKILEIVNNQIMAKSKFYLIFMVLNILLYKLAIFLEASSLFFKSSFFSGKTSSTILVNSKATSSFVIIKSFVKYFLTWSIKIIA